MTVPDSVKETVEKTVTYVLKNGPTFEERLLKNAPDKFHFLKESDEFNQYYKEMLQKRKDHDNDPNYTHAEIGKEKEPSLDEPEPLQFLVDLPPIIGEDLTVIKLTALFVAINGSEYEDKIKESQSSQSQFDFLNPKHSLYSLYLLFVEQYKKSIEIKQIENTSEKLLLKAYNRAQYEVHHRDKINRTQKELKAKQEAYASIDWQDFAIVGRIFFDEIDEVKELPKPFSREELMYRSLTAKGEEQKSQDIKKANDLETSNDTDPSKVTEYIPKGMKIKKAGELRVKRKINKVSDESKIKCPVTGELVPELEFDKHLKNVLRDPRYEEQRENFNRKNFGYASNLSTDEVYENIRRITDKRKKLKK